MVISQKRIAALIVNWNKEKDVLNLLSDLYSTNELSFDIFIVDNNSSDNSVKSIQNRFPSVKLILNSKNLGGTGGFNSGLKHICQSNQYQYIWLLDNDARITNSTLKELATVLDSNKDVGLAGSRIQDIDMSSVIVETGANFKWDTIGVIPVNRNSIENLSKIIDVDYVAICSALVRVSAIKKVGIMDARMFLFWDDMDWGLCFKHKGYRVVAATKSIAYHGSFTEKDRGDITNYYYGVRNAFLTYSKHSPKRFQLKIFFNALRFYLKLFFFFKFHGNILQADLIKLALIDFYQSNWGKFEGQKLKPKIFKEKISKYTFPKAGKILVSLIGVSQEISQKLLNQVRILNPKSEIYVLISDDRKNYFLQYPMIMNNLRETSKVGYIFRKLISLYKHKFDFVISTIPTPFLYGAPKALLYNAEKEFFYSIKTGFVRLYKLIFLNLFGEFLAVCLLPFFIKKGEHYKKDYLRSIR